MQMEIASCIRGYHIYQTIWKAAPGETFDCILKKTKLQE